MSAHLTFVSYADHLGTMCPTPGLKKALSGRLYAPVFALDLEPISGRSNDHLPVIGNSDSAVYVSRRDARHAWACDEPLAGVQAEAVAELAEAEVVCRPPEGEEGVAVEAGSRSGVDKSQPQ